MVHVDASLKAADLAAPLEQVFRLAAAKTQAIERRRRPGEGAPVFTVEGRYTARGWTEWTQGFQYGAALLVFDATGDEEMLRLGRRHTLQDMAGHLTHTGVHDHGFNNVSTYGALRRLMNEGRIPENPWERSFYELALKVSGAVQAARWTALPDGLGYIYSFNGPHSLFADTIRSLRALVLGALLGHTLRGERDCAVDLLERALRHAETTARYNVYFGEQRDAYDERGRVAHESIFNLNDGSYRCPSTQQGYSPFSTWTRGQAWILLGFAELLEFVQHAAAGAQALPAADAFGGAEAVAARLAETARAAADHYLQHTPTDGIPYWDTGAPGLARLGDYRSRPADPYNDWEPVDSSAAAIAAQGFLRLGACLGPEGAVYERAGLTIARTLFSAPYLSEDERHEGLILHSVYHRPNGWDYVPEGARTPRGESSMWGDYHALELALLVRRMAAGGGYRFFD